jgi:hypothetical protein
MVKEIDAGGQPQGGHAWDWPLAYVSYISLQSYKTRLISKPA